LTLSEPEPLRASTLPSTSISCEPEPVFVRTVVPGGTVTT
jgi:hypothetical protein